MQDREEGRLSAEAALHERTRAAVLDIVTKQAEIGLSVINDGEQGRADYTIYVKDRLTGFGGESAPWPNADAEEFPEWTEMARQFAPAVPEAAGVHRPGRVEGLARGGAGHPEPQGRAAGPAPTRSS